MKTKIIIALIGAILFIGCSTPGYLPSYDKIDVNQFGSYIKIIRKSSSNITGELISVVNDTIIVLEEQTNKCISVPINDVKRFALRYAKQKHYGWTIPLLTLVTLSHGYAASFTAPITLIITTWVTISGEAAYKYNQLEINYDGLKMFSRFPHGIPPGIDPENIKPGPTVMLQN